MTSPDKAESFVFLLARHERQVAAYVMTLVPQLADAEDILQQAKVVMWRAFDEFTPGTNFLAWARKVAFHQVLSWRRRRRGDTVMFSEEFLAAVADESDRATDALDEKYTRLSACLEKLLPEHRTIVELRYKDGLAVEDLATRVNRTVAAVYRVLSRIRANLFACVNGQPSPEGGHEPEPS